MKKPTATKPPAPVISPATAEYLVASASLKRTLAAEKEASARFERCLGRSRAADGYDAEASMYHRSVAHLEEALRALGIDPLASEPLRAMTLEMRWRHADGSEIAADYAGAVDAKDSK